MPRRTARRTTRRLAATVGATVLVAALAAGCGSGGAPVGPPVTVAATLYPLAQVAAAIGGSAVHVVDLTAPGQDPRTLAATPARRAALRSADVDLVVGGGFQPALEQAATAAHVVALAPRFGPGVDGAWLDPVTMEAVLPVVTAALDAAAPRDAGRFANGREDLYEQLSSVSGDFQDAISACQHDTVAAPGPTLTDLTTQYRVRLQELVSDPDPSRAAEASDARHLAAAGISTVLTLPWVPDGAARDIATLASAKTRALDTAEAPPAGGWPEHTSYVGLLDQAQGSLLAALGCPSSTDSQ